MNIHFKNKNEYLTVVRTEDLVFYYGDPDKQITWQNWVESIGNGSSVSRARLVESAEKINADFLTNDMTPSSLIFRDQKSYVLFRLKYG